jgi:hypothetical protein
MTVHAAIGYEPKKMETMSTRARKSFLQNTIPRELAVGDCFVNSGQILIDDPSRTQIEMADFGVAHLAVGQTDIGTAGAEFSPRIFPVKLVVEGCAREERGVSVLFTLPGAAGVNAPAIAHDKHDGLRHIARTVPTIHKIDKRFFR